MIPRWSNVVVCLFAPQAAVPARRAGRARQRPLPFAPRADPARADVQVPVSLELAMASLFTRPVPPLAPAPSPPRDGEATQNGCGGRRPLGGGGPRGGAAIDDGSAGLVERRRHGSSGTHERLNRVTFRGTYSAGCHDV